MRKRVLAVIAAVVVAAVALWALLLRHSSHESAAVQTPHTSPGDRARPERGAPDDRESQPSVLVDDDPKGSLRLEGQVVDADDHPVAAATVTLSSNPPRTATTEADGSFAFDALVARPYTLTARAKQGIAGPVTARLSERSDPVVLHLRPGAKVTVTVVGGDSKPIDGATVELRGTDSQRQTTKAGTTTFDAVVPGGYQVAAWADGLARTLQWLQVGAGDHTVKLILMPGAPVAGRVVDEKGAGVAGARVTFHGASDWSQQADDRYDAVTSGKDGAFQFAALPSGSFRFAASHPDFAPGQSTMVTLDGKHEHTGITITVGAGATVRGTVVDTQGKPVAGARVRIGRSSRRGMIFEPPRQAYSDGNGAFELKGLPRHELVAVAMHETGASKNEDVDTTNGDVGNVKLVIDITGTISGIVVDPQGQPVEGVQVSAGPNFRDQRGMGDFQNFRMRGFPSELTDGSGKFTLTGLAPGSYMVTAMRSQAASRGRRGTTEGTVAETGTKDLKLVLQPEGGIKGKVAL
ncbi:MAG: carboxypeptidase regulatory-like domain-containing protein, partial [Deltaproteobacteria bacterium]|nr:carboxypeptidase regulatory-like domain-containing protein [Deltaproteobacteria bacterium]